MKTLKLAALSLALATSNAFAVEFGKVDTAKSSIAFSYKQMGVNMDGRFKKFTADIKFDPAKASAATASLDVELASIDVGSPDGNSEVGGKLGLTPRCFRPPNLLPPVLSRWAEINTKSWANWPSRAKPWMSRPPPPSRFRAIPRNSTVPSPSNAMTSPSVKVSGPIPAPLPTKFRSSFI